MIEKISFGSMIIDGRTFTSDLMIFPDGTIKDHWWRSEGHRLTIEDMAALVNRKPGIVVVGTGIYGRMKPERRLKESLAEMGIEIVTAWTKAAAQQYNTLAGERREVAACFHLTC
jgi:hypothetical protein